MNKYIVILVVSVIFILIPSNLPISNSTRIDEADLFIRFERVCAMNNHGRLEFGKIAESGLSSIDFSYSTLEAPDFFIIKDTIIIVNYRNHYDVQTSGKDFVMITTDAMKPYKNIDSTKNANYHNYYGVLTSAKDFVVITADTIESRGVSDSGFEHLPGANLKNMYHYYKSYRYVYQYLNSLKLMDSISFDTPIYMISIKESCRGYEIKNLKTNKILHEFWDEPLNPYK